MPLTLNAAGAFTASGMLPLAPIFPPGSTQFVQAAVASPSLPGWLSLTNGFAVGFRPPQLGVFGPAVSGASTVRQLHHDRRSDQRRHAQRDAHDARSEPTASRPRCPTRLVRLDDAPGNVVFVDDFSGATALTVPGVVVCGHLLRAAAGLDRLFRRLARHLERGLRSIARGLLEPAFRRARRHRDHSGPGRLRHLPDPGNFARLPRLVSGLAFVRRRVRRFSRVRRGDRDDRGHRCPSLGRSRASRSRELPLCEHVHRDRRDRPDDALDRRFRARSNRADYLQLARRRAQGRWHPRSGARRSTRSAARCLVEISPVTLAVQNVVPMPAPVAAISLSAGRGRAHSRRNDRRRGRHPGSYRDTRG